jgi:hypothetical protein
LQNKQNWGSLSRGSVRKSKAGPAPIEAVRVKNIQIIDVADNATYSIFQATEQEFEKIFPQTGQDIEVVEDYFDRVGEDEAIRTLSKL